MGRFGADGAAVRHVSITDAHQRLGVYEDVRAATSREGGREMAGMAGANVRATVGGGQIDSPKIEILNV